MADNRDSFEFRVSPTGFALKAQGKVTALLSALMSIGAMTVAAYFAQEAFLPMLKKKQQLQLEEGDGDQVRTRSKRSAVFSELPSPEEPVEEKKRPMYVAAGISMVAVATSIYFGRRAWVNLASRVKMPRSE